MKYLEVEIPGTHLSLTWFPGEGITLRDDEGCIDDECHIEMNEIVPLAHQLLEISLMQDGIDRADYDAECRADAASF